MNVSAVLASHTPVLPNNTVFSPGLKRSVRQRVRSPLSVRQIKGTEKAISGSLGGSPDALEPKRSITEIEKHKMVAAIALIQLFPVHLAGMMQRSCRSKVFGSVARQTLVRRRNRFNDFTDVS